MAVSVGFSVLRWAMWAPGLLTRESICEWARGKRQIDESVAVPAIDFIPSAVRRRCSRSAKIALGIARAALDQQELSSTQTVFASRHGESEITLNLLESLVRQEPLSPMGFSLSVHNSASGLFSIAAANRSSTTALAARHATMSAGLIESLGILASATDRERKVLFVCSDENLPPIFREEVDDNHPSYATALLLQAQGNDLQVSAEELPSDSPRLNCLTLTKFLLDSGSTDQSFDGDAFGIRLRKSSRAFSESLRGICDARAA